MRACFVGDSFTHGTGDVDGMGWRGRVVAAVRRAGGDLTAYDLGVRRDTSGDILARWLSEIRARLTTDGPHRLIFAFGSNDCAEASGGPRVDPAQTLANTRAILTEARALAPTIMIGPAPIGTELGANTRIARITPLMRALCSDLGVPFLPVFDALNQSDAWRMGAARGDGVHPDGAGYAVLADLILNWPAFRAHIRMNGGG